MISKHRSVDLDDAVAGMILAADVLDHQGSVLLPAGAALSDQLLSSMRRRAIDSVRIVGDALGDAELAAERARVAQRLAWLFRRQDAGAANALLRAGLEAHRLDALQ